MLRSRIQIADSSLRLLRGILLRRRKLVAFVLGAGLLAAAFEGSTMGIFALALYVLTEQQEASAALHFGVLGELTDHWLQGLGRDALFLLLVSLAVASQLLRSLLRFSGDVAAARLLSRVEGETRSNLFHKFFKLSFHQTRRYKIGDLSSYMSQVAAFGEMLLRVNVIVSQTLLLVAYLVVLCWLSWIGTLLAVCFLLLATLALQPIVRRIRLLGEHLKRIFVNLSELTVEFLNGLRSVRTFARETFATEKVDQLIRESVSRRRQILIWQLSMSPLLDSMAVIGVGGFLLAGYLYIGKSDPGTLARYATFLLVLYRLAPRLSAINKNWGFANSRFPMVDRIATFLEEAEEALPRTDPRAFEGFRDKIEFRDVVLRYPDRQAAALESVSLTVGQGETVALVGPSGAGKSSLADLLIGLVAPSSGQVLIDGVDLQVLDWTSWRQRIGVVSQDTFLFNASIEENLAFGKLEASHDEIVRASRLAHAHEFIERLPDGYSTMIGDQGHRLSGGQRQRLAIARAFLRDPEILILDEATSDLDSESEGLIRESFARLRIDRTVLVIAHRFSTVADADRILVFDEGRIVETGRHSELVSKGGLYSRLWSLQTETRAEAQTATPGPPPISG